VGSAYVWAPWLLVILAVAALVYRGRARLRLAGLIREASLVVVAYGAYYAVRGSTEGSQAAAIDHARALVDVERALRMHFSATAQEALARHDVVALAANWAYIWWHWPPIIVLAVWLFLDRRDAYTRYRIAFVLSGAVALLWFATFPVAPPRLAELGFADTLAEHSKEYVALESPRLVNRFAAFPSLHFGWNLLVGIALVRETRTRWLKALGVASPALVLFAVVVSGNHYVIDAVAGGVLAVASLMIAPRLEATLARARAAVAAPLPARAGGR
jgi:hypothetical protein